MVFNLTKIYDIQILKTIVFAFNGMFFHATICFFLIVGFIYVINWKILKINIPKEMKTKLVVQSTLVALIENMVFVPWFANK